MTSTYSVLDQKLGSSRKFMKKMHLRWLAIATTTKTRSKQGQREGRTTRTKMMERKRKKNEKVLCLKLVCEKLLSVDNGFRNA